MRLSIRDCSFACASSSFFLCSSSKRSSSVIALRRFLPCCFSDLAFFFPLFHHAEKRSSRARELQLLPSCCHDSRVFGASVTFRLAPFLSSYSTLVRSRKRRGDRNLRRLGRRRSGQPHALFGGWWPRT